MNSSLNVVIKVDDSQLSLIAGDAGRPITEIATDPEYPEMATREVQQTLAFIQKQVTTRDGRWFLVCIIPYCTSENRIDGVVITFSNITEAKTLEALLRQSLAGAEKRPKRGRHEN